MWQQTVSKLTPPAKDAEIKYPILHVYCAVGIIPGRPIFVGATQVYVFVESGEDDDTLLDMYMKALEIAKDRLNKLIDEFGDRVHVQNWIPAPGSRPHQYMYYYLEMDDVTMYLIRHLHSWTLRNMEM